MGMKEAYEQQQRAKLKEWQADIDKLQARAEKAGASARIEFHQQIEDLRAQRKATESKLDDLARAGEQQWDAMKSGIEGALRDMGDRIKATSALFRK